MRYVLIDLSSDNYLEQPKIFGGYAGEHNETVLQVKLPKRMLGAEYSGYRFEFQTSEDNKIICPLISSSKLDDGILSFPLAEQLTVAGNLLFNIAAISLNGSIASLISKTNMVTLYIGDSSDGNDVALDPNGYKDEILEMIDEQVAQSVENLVENFEEKEILTTTEFNDIAVNTEVEGVKTSGDLFEFQDGVLNICAGKTYSEDTQNAIIIDFESYTENDGGSSIFNIGTKSGLNYNSLNDENTTKVLAANFSEYYLGHAKTTEIVSPTAQTFIPAGIYKITYDYFYYEFKSQVKDGANFSYKFSNGSHSSYEVFGEEIVDITKPQKVWNEGEMIVEIDNDVSLCVTLQYSPYHIYLDNINFIPLKYELTTPENLVLNNDNSITTLSKGRYQISYDYQILEWDYNKRENASILFGKCLKDNWNESSWNTLPDKFLKISYNKNKIAHDDDFYNDIYEGIRYETRHEQMGDTENDLDKVDFSSYRFNTWYTYKLIFEITEDNSIIVIATKNLTNSVQIKNIKISEVSEKVNNKLNYSEVNKSPSSQALWEGMTDFVHDTISRTQQHSHWEAKALSNLITTAGERVFKLENIETDKIIGGMAVCATTLYRSANTANAGSYLIISPNRNTYEGNPRAYIFNESNELLKLPKGTYIVKYKWRQMHSTFNTFVNFDKYCNRMPYLKFVNQLDKDSWFTDTTGIDISGNILKYRGNYWGNRWYEDSYIFTIDDSNYGGYFGIKAGYLQRDINIKDVEIYSISKNCYDKEEVDIKFGDIDTALDEIIAEQEKIIAIQNALIGGGNV